MSVATKTAQDREAIHLAKILEVVRSRLQEARRARITGKLTIEIQLNKGGPTNTYSEVGCVYRILEEA